jgi:hypothetical protein
VDARDTETFVRAIPNARVVVIQLVSTLLDETCAGWATWIGES